MTTTTLPSANEDSGFFGTMQHGGADPMQSWNAASAMIAVETEASPEGVRDFLDCRHGRHFADDVLAGSPRSDPRPRRAIEATVARWQAWRIIARPPALHRRGARARQRAWGRLHSRVWLRARPRGPSTVLESWPAPCPGARTDKTREGTKQLQLIAMLERPEGATIKQIVAATGRQLLGRIPSGVRSPAR